MATYQSSFDIAIKPKMIIVECVYGHALHDPTMSGDDKTIKKRDKYCAYCGSVRNYTRSNCRNCGAC
jgi:hypothetical protein